jgi:hypothetical protein
LSEASEEKTTRKLVSSIKKYEPTFTTSLFLTNYGSREDIIAAFSEIRSPISRTMPDITIIWYLRLLLARTKYIDNTPIMYNKTKILLPMIQLFTTGKVDTSQIETVICTHTNICFNLRQRKFDKDRWIDTVKNQKPHDLQSYFKLSRSPRRFNITNKITEQDITLENLIADTLVNIAFKPSQP